MKHLPELRFYDKNGEDLFDLMRGLVIGFLLSTGIWLIGFWVWSKIV